MASAYIWSTVSTKSQVYPTLRGTRKIERGRTEYCLALHKDSGYLSPSLVGESDGRWRLSRHLSESHLKVNKSELIWLTYSRYSPLRKTIDIPLLEVYNTECHEKCISEGSHQRDKTCASDPLKSPDFYFSKLEGDMDEKNYHSKECHMASSSQSLEQPVEGTVTAKDLYTRKATLDLLQSYFGELNNGQYSKMGMSAPLEKENSEVLPLRRPTSAVDRYREGMKTMEPKSFVQVSIGNEISEGLQPDDEASDFYLINILAAINIAVFLFEIASPIRNSELEQLSLPLIFGGKINKLILVGEWWRLVTPMFLVQD